MDMNATTFVLLAAASVLVGIVSLWLVRRQPHNLFPSLKQGPRNQGHSPRRDASEPDIRVLYGEFFQVRLGGDETDKAIRYEATTNFRLLIANRGLGGATSIRARAICDGMAKPSWSTSGWLDLASDGEQDVILRSLVLPPVGPEEVCWVEAPLRIEYQDTLGNDWYTLTRLRLKFIKVEGSDSYACWWVDVLEPQEHGRVEEVAKLEKRPVQGMPVVAAPAAQPAAPARSLGEPLPFPARDKGQEWVAVPVTASSNQRSRPGDAAAAGGL